MGELNGQTYLVTGASKGIGRSISLELANHGAQVILLSGQAGSSTKQQRMSKPRLPPRLPYRVTLATFLHRCGCPGHSLSGHSRTPRFGPQRWRHSSDQAAVRCGHRRMDSLHDGQPRRRSTSHAATRVGASGRPSCRVTTISSGAALRPLASWSAYCTAKAGLDMWTRCLAEEGAQHNITAVSVAPGIVNTGMQTAIRSASEEDFPLLDNFVGYHVNGWTCPMQTPSPRRCMVSLRRTRKGNQVSVLTLGICRNSSLFGRRVISQHLDSGLEGYHARHRPC